MKRQERPRVTGFCISINSEDEKGPLGLGRTTLIIRNKKTLFSSIKSMCF